MRSPPIVLTLVAAFAALAPPGFASDHADPIDPLHLRPLDPVITDLFVFPVDARGELVIEADGPVAALAVVLCVRRALTNKDALDLRKYTYTIHVDTSPAIDFDDPDARARYGGAVIRPETIAPRVEIAFRLDDGPALLERRLVNVSNADRLPDPRIGVFDDPFIFPRFSRTNVVGIVQRIPLERLPDPAQKDFLFWATTRGRWKQIDHVGRALRTQNPRFELLNTLPPRRHVAALEREHEHPGLMRDVKLFLGFGSLFGFRTWDFAPDVLIYSRRFDAAFPNGRRLDEDVVGALAALGDTLAFELSFRQTTARRTAHEPPPLTAEPYLLPRLTDPRAEPPHRLRLASRVKIVLLVVFPIAAIVLLTWWLTRRHEQRKHRLRYV